jgi:hypothetical protein
LRPAVIAEEVPRAQVFAKQSAGQPQKNKQPQTATKTAIKTPVSKSRGRPSGVVRSADQQKYLDFLRQHSAAQRAADGDGFVSTSALQPTPIKRGYYIRGKLVAMNAISIKPGTKCLRQNLVYVPDDLSDLSQSEKNFCAINNDFLAYEVEPLSSVAEFCMPEMVVSPTTDGWVPVGFCNDTPVQLEIPVGMVVATIDTTFLVPDQPQLNIGQTINMNNIRVNTTPSNVAPLAPESAENTTRPVFQRPVLTDERRDLMVEKIKRTLDAAEISPAERAIAEKQQVHNHDIFALKDTDHGDTGPDILFQIKTGLAEPTAEQPRYLPHAYREKVRQQVQDYLKADVIRPSTPVLGRFRSCQCQRRTVRCACALTTES